MDRQILSILAEDIKADLRLTDAQVGFVYSTALSVFFAIFSIPLGRCADVLTRKNMLAVCVSAWSAMIFLTGTAGSALSFALFRAGVGVGEGGASPPAFSMISDYFPPRLRNSAMSVFTSGSPVGQGLGLFLGGFILDAWSTAYPVGAAPFGLKAWQVAFFAIALPGPLLAVWLWSLREPVRGQSEGLASAPQLSAQFSPWRQIWDELQSVLPLVCLLRIVRLGGGARAIAWNIAAGLTLAAASTVLVVLTGSTMQWAAIGIGLYCVAGWAQTLKIRDPAAFAMILKCPTLLFVDVGLACFVFVVFGVGAWIAPFMIRVHGVSPRDVGAMVGTLLAICGFLGNLAGGALADMLERRTPRARLYVLLGSLTLTVPSVVLMLYAQSAREAYLFIGLFFLASAAWYGVGPAMVNSLVMPRMRGISSAFYMLVITLLGMALGPYAIGYVSDIFTASGAQGGAALRQGMLWGLAISIPAAAALIGATATVARDQATRNARAQKLGEKL